jgi:hypothetical protein
LCCGPEIEEVARATPLAHGTMAKPRKRLRRSSRHLGTVAKPIGLAEDASEPLQLFAGRVKRPADPRLACALLLKYLGARAPTEALLHAFFAERDLDRASAQFWIEAYQLIVERRTQG